MLQPYLPWLFGFALFYAVLKIADSSVGGTVRETVREFVDLLRSPKINQRSINAMGGVLLFVVVIVLNFSGLAHLILPSGGEHATDTGKIVTLITVIFFGTYFILCILVSRFQR